MEHLLEYPPQGLITDSLCSHLKMFSKSNLGDIDYRSPKSP